MTDTRPGELSRHEAQRIAQETAALMRIADNEREYREHVLVTLARLEVKFDNLATAFAAHEQLDEQRHTTVTQRIGTNEGWINKALGMSALFVVMIGVVFFVIERMSK